MAVRQNHVQVVFHSLEVGVLSDNSGIFIGTNQAHLWSSHNKNNSGLGNMDGEALHCTNVVYDNDHIDAPVDDRDTLIIQEATEQSEQQAIGFDQIRAGSLGSNSTISIGQNRQQGWSAHSKANHGVGVAATILSDRSVNSIADNDRIDAPVRNLGVASVANINR